MFQLRVYSKNAANHNIVYIIYFFCTCGSSHPNMFFLWELVLRNLNQKKNIPRTIKHRWWQRKRQTVLIIEVTTPPTSRFRFGYHMTLVKKIWAHWLIGGPLPFFFGGGGGLRIEKPAHQPKWLFEGIFSDGSMSSGSSWNRYSFPLPERSWAWVLNTYICIHEKCINTSIIQRQRHRQRQISGLTKKTFFTVTKVHIFVHVYVFVYCLRQT